MKKHTLKKILAKLGWELRQNANGDFRRERYKLISYKNEDGSFDYAAYRDAQVAANKRKIEKIWTCEENIAFLSNYLKERLGNIQFGICHGTRRGNEQLWFRKYLGCEVIGTEISDTASQFPHTIEWDFHKAHPDWLNKADFIYSNSFDHSYEPEACINTWVNCLRPGGLCVLEHSDYHGPEKVSITDPFGADIEVMPYLLTLWARERFFVRAILDAPVKVDKTSDNKFIVIERRI